MKAVSGKQLCQILEKKSWMLARVTGSHHIYIKQGTNYRITIPVHGKNDLKIGLLKTIMKIAEIDESEL
jgi:predicted RNA binding protein YcfA (HicA-like mRNA interferase family)